MAMRVLVVGATGYIGRFIVRASVAAGFSTCALVRLPNPRKSELLDEFSSGGVEIFHGSLEDQDSLIAALKNVDIVVSAVGIPQVLDQLRLIEAMKNADCEIKRFIPSEFGSDVDKINCLKPCQDAVIEPKIRVRRATELAGIPYTYMVTNGFARFHFNMQEQDGKLKPPSEFTIYGDGNVKACFVVEEDIGYYTMKAAIDPRTLNKTLHIRSPANVLSRNETAAILERETQQVLKKQYVSEQELLKAVEETSDKITALVLSFMHSAHVQGDTFGFQLGPMDVESHELYPGYVYTDAHNYLKRYIH